MTDQENGLPPWDNLTSIFREKGIIGPEDNFTGVIACEVEVLKDEYNYDTAEDVDDYIDGPAAAAVAYYHDAPALLKPPEGQAFFSIRRKDAPADEYIMADRDFIRHGL